LEYSSSALQAFSQATWPGNIRQLENSVERAVNICEQRVIMPDDLGLDYTDTRTAQNIASDSDHSNHANVPAEVANLDTNSEAMLGEMEQALIARLMNENDSNISKVARSLGVSRPTLYRKLKKYDLSQN
jgi:sigma-54 dependent transcriptional regulator, acetoin dehydrogenase operon transcriptional activator AcoR